MAGNRSDLQQSNKHHKKLEKRHLCLGNVCLSWYHYTVRVYQQRSKKKMESQKKQDLLSCFKYIENELGGLPSKLRKEGDICS